MRLPTGAVSRRLELQDYSTNRTSPELGALSRKEHPLKRLPVLAAVAMLFIAGCGGGPTGGMPGTTGTITGTISTSTTAATRVPAGRALAPAGGPPGGPAGPAAPGAPP